MRGVGEDVRVKRQRGDLVAASEFVDVGAMDVSDQRVNRCVLRSNHVTVILEQPKIRDHVDAMRAAVAAALGVDASRVSIKGKTNEGIDAIGRGEAIAAHAIALLRRV